MHHSSLQRALFAKARCGDAEALGQLLESLRPYVRAIVRAMRGTCSGNPSEDSDLIQNALLQVVRSAPTFHGESLGEWIGWLRTIVVRTTYRALEKPDLKTSTDQDQASLATQIVGPALEPGESAVRQERSARMALALARLPAEMQEVIRFRIEDDVDHREIARRMNRTPGAVRMLYLRALQRLRDVWAEEFAED